MTTAALARVLNLDGFLMVDKGLACPITITDAKVSYGQPRFEVEARSWTIPANESQPPMARQWVACDRVIVATPNGLVYGAHFAQG